MQSLVARQQLKLSFLGGAEQHCMHCCKCRDGTSSTVLLIGELMKQAERYISEGLHPRVLVQVQPTLLPLEFELEKLLQVLLCSWRCSCKRMLPV